MSFKKWFRNLSRLQKNYVIRFELIKYLRSEDKLKKIYQRVYQHVPFCEVTLKCAFS